jgi:hypothetical protein
MTTTPDNKVTILSDLWMTYRDDEEFEDLIEYADLALPLCYAIEAGFIKNNDKIAPFIDEAFELLLAGMELEDTGFENLDEVLEAVQ